MEFLLQWLTLHAEHAHYIIFGLLMLAGLSLPISEEIMLILSGVLASSIIPDHTVHLFISVFLGCYLSDWIAYWLGRKFGTKIAKVSWLPFSLNENRINRVQKFYKQYGFLTLFIGRFIPFGVRNGLFMIAGIGKMHFGRFILNDGIGCLVFTALIFSCAYSCGKNYETLYQFIHKSNWIIFILFLLVIAFTALFFWLKRKWKISEPTN